MKYKKAGKIRETCVCVCVQRELALSSSHMCMQIDHHIGASVTLLDGGGDTSRYINNASASKVKAAQ